MRKTLLLLTVVAMLGAAGCSGVRESNGTFVTHAEAFRIIGFAIPSDDQQAALDKVPPGGVITNVSAWPADWTSFLGFFGNLLSFTGTRIGGTK